MGCTKSKTDDEGPPNQVRPSSAVSDKKENKKVNKKESTSSASLRHTEDNMGGQHGLSQSSASTSVPESSGQNNQSRFHSGGSIKTSDARMTQSLGLDIFRNTRGFNSGTGAGQLDASKCCLLLWEKDNRPEENKDYKVLMA